LTVSSAGGGVATARPEPRLNIEKKAKRLRDRHKTNPQVPITTGIKH